jgi:hypothetical protein
MKSWLVVLGVLLALVFCVPLAQALSPSGSSSALINSYCGHSYALLPNEEKTIFQYHYTAYGTHWHTYKRYVKDYPGDPSWRFVKQYTKKCPQ